MKVRELIEKLQSLKCPDAEVVVLDSEDYHCEIPVEEVVPGYFNTEANWPVEITFEKAMKKRRPFPKALHESGVIVPAVKLVGIP